MGIIVTPINKLSAMKIIQWKYPPPYDIYNISSDDEENHIEYMMERKHQFYCLKDENGVLAGFFSLGKDGQVPGGNYVADAIDIGMGIRPDLTGRGNGCFFVKEILKFIRTKYQKDVLRVSIAQFNLRAQRLWEKNGFTVKETFSRPIDQRKFILMVKTD